MAITTNASYVPTAQEFIGHWSDVNDEIGGTSPLVLRTGMTLAQFSAIKTELEPLQSRLNDAQIARGAMHLGKRKMLYWFSRFMQMFNAYFGESDLAEARPLAPPVSSATENSCGPCWI